MTTIVTTTSPATGKTLLQIINSVARRMGLPTTAVVVSSTDEAILQFLEFAQEEGSESARRTNWSALTTEASFTTSASENQGLVNTIAPYLRFIINDTIYNRSLRRPVFGPLGPQSWQQKKAMFIAGPWNQFRIVGPYLKFIPVPTAGESCYFEYVTNAWCVDTTGLIPKSEFTADSDVPILEPELFILGIIWRWRQVKGLDFTADYEKYERLLRDAVARDGSKATLSMQGETDDIGLGIFIPAGSWPV